MSVSNVRQAPVDMTPGVLRHGYSYISDVMSALDLEVLRSRLLGMDTFFISGREAVRLFYDQSLMAREGAVPGFIKHSLFGRDTVHGLDGEPHRHRKDMFMRILSRNKVDDLTERVAAAWRRRVDSWSDGARVPLFADAAVTLCMEVARWAGLQIPAARVEALSRDLTLIVDGFGGGPFRQWRAREARSRANMWARCQIRALREGMVHPPKDSAFHIVAFQQHANGGLLDEVSAADELLNVLRPTIAVAWFVSFSAYAMHHHPFVQPQLAEGDEETVAAFVDELRRLYPFVPMLPAITTTNFTWRGVDFPAGCRVVLDVYGTNVDPREWNDPLRFDPDRFVGRDDDAFSPVPQGGGDAKTGHRCPGEPLTRSLLAPMVMALARLDDIEPLTYPRVKQDRIPPFVQDEFLVTRRSDTLIREPDDFAVGSSV